MGATENSVKMDQKKYATLLSVVREASAGRDETARRLLAHLVEHQLGHDAPAEDLSYYIFASALSRRVASDKQAEINLYLRRFQQTQISLFNLLARHLPTVALAGPVANAVLGRFVAERDEVTLLDVGIGSGRQLVALLYALAGRRRLPRRLNVVGVEPDADSLRAAGEALAETAAGLGVELTFHPVNRLVEELDDADWEPIAALGAPLVVNAAFAVHHVLGPARDGFFRRLRELEPEAVVLCEPSSDHHTSSLEERFQNAWQHFGLTFRLIDELEVGVDEKAAMKMFFAREIEDILANAEEVRCERHEAVDTWVQRLRRAGFTPYADFGFAADFVSDSVRVVPRDGWVGLDYRDETLVAVVCATTGIPAAAGRLGSRRLEQVA